MRSRLLSLTLGLACALSALLNGAAAYGQEVEPLHSPQSFALELKLGPYTPNVDDSVAAGTPYADIFGDGPGIMAQTELDWQIWRGFGSIALGVSAGYFRQSAQPLRDTGGIGQPSTSTERVAGETAITLVPVSLLAIYRFDVLAQRLHIPLVPYAKIGFNYTFWWMTNGDGDLAQYQGGKAQGGSWGLQFNLGLALLLDALEPQAAKNLDTDLGVNHSYLFVELHIVQANRFGSASALDVGDTTLLAGLAFEM